MFKLFKNKIKLKNDGNILNFNTSYLKGRGGKVFEIELKEKSQVIVELKCKTWALIKINGKTHKTYKKKHVYFNSELIQGKNKILIEGPYPYGVSIDFYYSSDNYKLISDRINYYQS